MEIRIKNRKRKIRNAIKTCFLRLNLPRRRLKSINSLGNIGKKYSGFVRDITVLLDFLSPEVDIAGVKINLEKPDWERIPREQYPRIHEESEIRKAAVVSIQKICKASPAVADQKVILSLKSCLGSRILGRYAANCMGFIARKNAFCLDTLKTSIINKNDHEIIDNAIISLGIAGEYDTELANNILPLLIINLENIASYPSDFWLRLNRLEKALVRIGKRHPSAVSSLVKEAISYQSKPELIGVAIRILSKIAHENPDTAEHYIPFIASGLESGSRYLMNSAVYGLGIIGSSRPQLIEPFLSSIFKYEWYTSNKAVYMIASCDLEMIFNFVKSNRIPLKSQDKIASSRPAELIRFYLDNSEYADFSLFIALSKSTSLSPDCKHGISALIGILVERDVGQTDNNIIIHYLAKAISRHPDLFKEHIPGIGGLLRRINEPSYILVALSDVVNAFPEARKPVFDIVFSYPEKLFYIIKFVENINAFSDPDVHDRLKRILKKLPFYETENFSYALLELSDKDPVLAAYSTDVIFDNAKSGRSKYCIRDSIIALGNILSADTKKEKTILPVIIHNLDHPHFRVFRAAQSVIKKISLRNPEMIAAMETYIKKINKPTISRRGLRVTGKINKRFGENLKSY